MTEFSFQPIFEKTKDSTTYRQISKDHVRTENFGDREVLVIKPEALRILSEVAFDDVSHLLRTEHLEGLGKILKDEEEREKMYLLKETTKKHYQKVFTTRTKKEIYVIPSLHQ
jgi:hypothetical protein